MPTGAGKYDHLATAARRDAEALGVIVIVIRGKLGSGFSVQLDDALRPFALPGLLRDVADQIDADLPDGRI
jgi:hypothetical protein